MRTHKYNGLNGNQVLKYRTPVTLTSVYDPNYTSEILRENLLVLLYSWSLHSMAKLSLFEKYKNDFFRK